MNHPGAWISEETEGRESMGAPRGSDEERGRQPNPHHGAGSLSIDPRSGLLDNQPLVRGELEFDLHRKIRVTGFAI
jgi:hypothetical protein